MDTPSSSALLLAFLMLLAPVATAATVNTFSDGETEVSIEMRDPIDYTNSEDGVVRLPAGETVTSASVTAFADPIAHAWYTNVDSTVNPNVWDPAVNNLKTSVSSTTDLVYQNEVVKLRAEDSQPISKERMRASSTRPQHRSHSDGSTPSQTVHSSRPRAHPERSAWRR